MSPNGKVNGTFNTFTVSILKHVDDVADQALYAAARVYRFLERNWINWYEPVFENKLIIVIQFWQYSIFPPLNCSLQTEWSWSTKIIWNRNGNSRSSWWPKFDSVAKMTRWWAWVYRENCAWPASFWTRPSHRRNWPKCRWGVPCNILFVSRLVYWINATWINVIVTRKWCNLVRIVNYY